MEPVKNIPTQARIVEDFIRITVERFQKSIEKAGVSKERNILFDSFVSELQKGGSDTVERARIMFMKYGRYVDMGVGRGVPIGSAAAKADFERYRYAKNTARFKRGQLKKYGRKPKKWYSRTLAGQIKKLSELMMEHYGIGSIQLLEEKMIKQVEIIL